jgi:RNA polymerase sigma-70 factor (ECF subfamily)
MTRALRSWPLAGIPADPGAWLRRVARNHAVDVLRRARSWEAREASVRAASEVSAADGFFGLALAGSQPFGDDDLCMMFLCADPSLPARSRAVLTLKVIAGFGTDEIARAFFQSEASIAQRIVRAKRALREVGARFEMPRPEELERRRGDVLDVLYLIFNEGYTCHDGETVLRTDVMDEALRLAHSLLEHPSGNAPETRALVALLELQSSRTAARIDEDGALLRLAEQDRDRWDRGRIRAGLAHLHAAACGERLSIYHLLAGIAACHAVAPRVEETDWTRVVSYYDMLLEMSPSSLHALNRAVALSYAAGPGVALEVLAGLSADAALGDYHLLDAARGDCLLRLGRHAEAVEAFLSAASRAPTKAERRFLLDRAARVKSAN